MEVAITQGIKISVEPSYQPEHSNRVQHVFSYKIIITNNSKYTAQLMRRHWYIYDGLGKKREVKGEGVVGEQPILKPGDSFEYRSWCPCSMDIGMMTGTFEMQRIIDDSLFTVKVPNFILVTPWLLN